MTVRGCLDRSVFTLLVLGALGVSTYFWFGFFIRGKSIPTPDLLGKTLAQARAICSDAGLEIVVDNTRDRNAEKIAVGAVAWQNRPAGSLIKRGTRIYVGQSLGPLILDVPDVMGQSTRTALLRFSQRNLRLGNLSYLPTKGEGIIGQDPPVGTVVEGQTQVSLLVALPPPAVAFVMPDAIDRPVDDVRYQLESVGLTVSNIRYERYPGIADGLVIRQFPQGGAKVSSRDAISLVVSRQEEPTVLEPPG